MTPAQREAAERAFAEVMEQIDLRTRDACERAIEAVRDYAARLRRAELKVIEGGRGRCQRQ